MRFIRHAMTAVYLTGAFVSLASLDVAAAHGDSGWVIFHAALAAMNTMWAIVEIAGLLRPRPGGRRVIRGGTTGGPTESAGRPPRDKRAAQEARYVEGGGLVTQPSTCRRLTEDDA